MNGNRNVKVFFFSDKFSFCQASGKRSYPHNVQCCAPRSGLHSLSGNIVPPCLVLFGGCVCVRVCVFSCAESLASFPRDCFPQVLLHTDSVWVRTDKSLVDLLCTVQMDIFGT